MINSKKTVFHNKSMKTKTETCTLLLQCKTPKKKIRNDLRTREDSRTG